MIRKILLGIALTIGTLLTAQNPVVDNAGNPVVSGITPLTTIGPATYTTQETDAFVITDHFRFVDEILGEWTDTEGTAWQNSYNGFGTQEHWGVTSIINEDWNGTSIYSLEITHEAQELWHGYTARVPLSDTTKEKYLSYLWKLGPDFILNGGGKMTKFRSIKETDSGLQSERDNDRGWTSGLGFKEYYTHSYMYDDTDGHSNVPWGNDQDTVYMLPGTEYNIIQRVKRESNTGTVSDDNGVMEVWINGRLVLQETELTIHEHDYTDEANDIISFGLTNFYGGSDTIYDEPQRECTGIVSEIYAFDLPNDWTWDSHDAHLATDVIYYPGKMDNVEYYYDLLIDDAADNLESYNYPSYTEHSRNYRQLIDAGAGYTVQVDFQSGDETYSGEFLIFYDGNTTDDEEIAHISGTVSDLTSHDFGSGTNGRVVSTGRYMYVGDFTQYHGTGSRAGGDFSANITFVLDE